MPVDDEYGRRQIPQPSPPNQPSSALSQPSLRSSPVPQCAALSCVAAPAPDHRYASDKNLLDTTSDRYGDHRFGSERSHSDRLPSGERYQGGSERYPLGERPQTSISSERLAASKELLCQQPEERSDRYHYNTCQRYQEPRYVTPVGSLDRYHQSAAASGYRSSGKTARQHTQYRVYEQYERFPPIPCPERFAGGTDAGQYMEPPSPAPASDRFVPPPPLSPVNAPISPNTFPNNAFPSPTAPNSEPRFIPPPPLSPSPTEAVKYSPKKVGWRYGDRYERYQHQEPRFKERSQYYGVSGSTDRYVNSDRYIPPNAHMPVERYVPQPQEPYFTYHQQPYERYAKYNASDPYMRRDLTYHYRFPLPCPPTAQYHHYQQRGYVKYVGGTPGARLQCCQYPDGYQLAKSMSPGSSSSSSSLTSQGNKEQLIHGGKECGHGLELQQCQSYQPGYHQEKATQCSNKETFTMRNSGTAKTQCKCTRHSICASPVEYVGASGGRHVCATPPPRGSVGSIEAAVCTDNCCSLRRSQNSLTVAVWRATPPVQQQPSQPSPPTAHHPQHHPPTRATSATPDDSSATSASSLHTDTTTKTCGEQDTSNTCTSTSATMPSSGTSPPSASRPQLSAAATSAATVPPSAQLQAQAQSSPSRGKPPPVQRTVSMPVTAMTSPERRPPRPPQRNISYTQNERLPNRPPLARSVSRREMIKNYIKKETATFFGVDEETEERERRKWMERRKRILSRSCGPLKPECALELPSRRTPSDLTPRSRMLGQLQAERPDVLPGSSDLPDYFAAQTEQQPQESTLRRKDSVARMTWDGLSYVVNTLTRHRPRRRSQQSQLSRSFPPDVPYNISRASEEEEHHFFERPSPSISQSPRIVEEEEEERLHHEYPANAAIGGIAGVGIERGLGERGLGDRGIVDRSLGERGIVERSLGDRGIVERSLGERGIVERNLGERGLVERGGGGGEDTTGFMLDENPLTSSSSSSLQPARYRHAVSSRAASSGGWRREPHLPAKHEGVGAEGLGRAGAVVPGQNRTLLGGSRVSSSLLDNVHDNSNRRQYGMGWIGKIFGRSIRGSIAEDDKIQEQLDDLEDHRPLFTYWVTTVQILVLVISLICYGFGPPGFDLKSRSGQVLVTSLSLQQVEYLEPANFWLGPRAGDLIHLGAKFAPCMRVDQKISQEIDKIRARERETACCIRNDDSGCVQSSQADCSKAISTWKKWSALEQGPGGRLSGSVCGLDPKFCDAPASVHPYEWPDDITKWPICRKTNMLFSMEKRPGQDKIAEHMVCEVIGHPCCIGIHGHCKMTTKEYCDFVRGTFHEEASLCAQVSCLNDVCGMLPFYFPEIPDQFYRLWTSIFLHAGILQLMVTVFVQFLIMRNLEKLTGSLRIGIIYIGSGVAGNLASAIFVPYRADVGPAGCQFGLLACLIVEVLNVWRMLRHPRHALCKLLSITFTLFLVGLLPWVDNYAHLFGFIFGFLLSYALMPFISFGPYDRHKKIALIWVCLLSAGFLFICLILLFYIIPVYDCKVCSYFNCIPFTNDFCASQNINFKKQPDPYSV